LLSFNPNANGPQNVTLLNLNTSVFDRIGFITLTSMGVSSMKSIQGKLRYTSYPLLYRYHTYYDRRHIMC